MPKQIGIRRAYEQVADQVRAWIMSGQLNAGDPLPTEYEMSQTFRTSRGTIREALRLLASQQLVVTRPGAGGGSVVNYPDPAWWSDSLQTSLTLLVRSQDVSQEDLILVRHIMEVPAAGLAAVNRDESDLERLKSCIPDDPLAVSIETLFEMNNRFHKAVSVATHSTMFHLTFAPLIGVSAERVDAERYDESMRLERHQHHVALLEAIREQDVAGAKAIMSTHVDDARVLY